jgi:S1-C subfamily serine protease
VTGVDSEGAGGRAGLVRGDLILEMNNATVRNVRELSLEMENVHEDDLVEIRIMRIRVGAFRQIQRQYRARLRAHRKRTRRL